MNRISRGSAHKLVGKFLVEKLAATNIVFKVIGLFVSLYQAILDFATWARFMRSDRRPLNELTLEGLYMKELEIFYFDFFDHKDWEKTKDVLRCLVTSVVLAAIFYLMATYLMDLDLRTRVMATSIISTLLTLLLASSPASRAITYLMIPSMAQGSLRSALLIGAVILLSAGPANNVRNNLDAISSTKACLHEQYFDIVNLVKSLRGRNLINLVLVAFRLVAAAIQLVAEILYRVLHKIYIVIDKLIATMKRFFKQLGRMLKKLKPKMDFKGGCLQLTRRLTKKYRRVKIYGAHFQLAFALFSLARFVTGKPPFGKPTIGYFIHKIGAGIVCPLLTKVREIYEKKKKALTQWWELKVMRRINNIKAVADLLLAAIGPDTRVYIRMKGGLGHQMQELKRQMQMAFVNKTQEVKAAHRFASRVVQIVCCVLSLVVFLVTLLLSIKFYKGYIKSDDYENNYITAPFVRLEEIEKPLLPLDSYEKSRVSVLADAMISDIVKRLDGTGLLFAFLRLVPFIIILMLDWILYVIARFLETTFDRAIEVERNIDIRLGFKGPSNPQRSPMALLLTIVMQIQTVLREINLDINILACAPKSSQPNWVVNIFLVLLLICYTALTLFGPFFLKLRHHIMLEMEPARSVQRAVWLRRELESDRQLFLKNRDHLKQKYQEQQTGTIQYLFNTHVKEGLGNLTDMLRMFFNLPTIRCAECGVRGSLSLKNFNDFFTVCDSCEKSICAPCAHYIDQDGAVKLRDSCPACGLKMEDVEIDEEEIDEEDPLNNMLYKFLDLTPAYRISRSALDEQLAEIRAFKKAEARMKKRSFMTTFGLGTGADSGDKKTDS